MRTVLTLACALAGSGLVGCGVDDEREIGVQAAAGVERAVVPAHEGDWASVREATLHPGVQTYTRSGQCTANFVFTDRDDNVYLGQAAHCSGVSGAGQTNGCKAEVLPIGTRVTFTETGTLLSQGERVGSGVLAYSSWNTMQQRKEKGRRVCAFNDFALVRVAERYVDDVNPTVPFWGGPEGINGGGIGAGEMVYSYGHSSIFRTVPKFRPMQGISPVGDHPSHKGWSHTMTGVIPGLPGDSGSAFLDAEGDALGTLSTLHVEPLLVTNGIGDLAKELSYAKRHSGIRGLRLVLGTREFDPRYGGRHRR